MGLLAVVVIVTDRQAGHLDGGVTVLLESSRVALLPNEWNAIRPSRDLSHDLAFGDFQLCGEGDLVRADDARCAPASKLLRTKASQNCELEPAECGWTLDHSRPAPKETKALVDMQPPQQRLW